MYACSGSSGESEQSRPSENSAQSPMELGFECMLSRCLLSLPGTVQSRVSVYAS